MRAWPFRFTFVVYFQHLFGSENYTTFTKDAFHRCIIHGEKNAVNPKKRGTKVAPYYLLEVPAGDERVLRCRLMAEDEIVSEPFAERNFGAVIQNRLKEANQFYNVAIPCKYFCHQRVLDHEWILLFFFCSYPLHFEPTCIFSCD